MESRSPGPNSSGSGSQAQKISKYEIFWKLVRSFNGICQNDQGTSSFKSSAITIFVVFWQKYFKSSSSLAETHWLRFWITILAYAMSQAQKIFDFFWILVRSFNGIYQNDQGTSSLKSSAITIFVVFWQKYLKSSSSLAETHWLTVWSLGHLGPIAQAQDLRISGSQAQAQAQDCHWCLRLWKPGHSQTQMGSETWDMRHWDIGNLGELAVLGFGYWEIRI